MVILGIIICGVCLLTPLVIIHEGGHFLAARTFGMRVSEFFVGLPCRFRLSRKTKHGTEVGITPILLGGYNLVLGMETTEDDKLLDVLSCVNRHGRVTQAEVSKEVGIDEDRTRILLASLVDTGSIKPYYDESKGERRWQKAWPESFETVARDSELHTILDKGYDANDEGGIKEGEVLIVSPAKVYDFDVSNTYIGKKRWQKLFVLVAGPLANILTAFILIVVGLGVVGITEYDELNVVGQIVEDSFAEEAGLQVDDKLVSVEGVSVSTWSQFFNELDEYFGQGEGNKVEIGIERNGEPMTLMVEVPNDKEGKIGIVKHNTRRHLNPVEAAGFSFEYFGKVMTAIVQLFTPKAPDVIEQSASVVGISYMAYEYATKDAIGLLELLIAVSASLGFMNLLPIPPLDGGRIVIEGIEALRRQRVSQRAISLVSAAGMGAVLILFAVMLFQDIGRIVGA